MYIHATILLLVLASCSAQFADEFQSFEPEECVGEDKFSCDSGTCIDQTQYCDGRADCDDGTDENYCPDHQPDADLCNQTHQFLCLDHRHCVSHRKICDGELDCNDGSDEANCTDEILIADGEICKGYQCNDGNCISKLWVCDGIYDCPDRSDEYREEMCRHSLLDHSILDGSSCQDGKGSYRCLDASYCLPMKMMCDGMKDCRDGSDEGDFCKNWNTMCSTHKCAGNNTQCLPDRSGPVCHCLPINILHRYNNVTHRCEDINECQLEQPHCSHRCLNEDGHFKCECDEGYVKDEYEYLCYAKGPEAMLFFSTRNEIKFLKIKSKQVVTVATGIKEAHGVSYDGQYLYWVEIAQGHQSIVRAHLEDIEETKQILAGFGLEDPGDISVDWLGRNIYFSDAVRGFITSCSLDGAHCATIPTDTNHPKFVTVDPRSGKMYWADYHKHSVIMSARMDGTKSEVLADKLQTFVTGLALDTPNGRLYFVDKTIKVLLISEKLVYSLFEEPFHRPYSIAVFENTVFWSDWTSMTIQTTDKLHGTLQKRNLLLSMDSPVFGMHIYHPALMPTARNPCAHHSCTHLCFVTSNVTHTCGCPNGMHLTNNTCIHMAGHRSKYIVVAEGSMFTRLEYNTIGNPEGHATNFDVGRVQAMAYDNVRDMLYVYDGQRRSVQYINMSEFTLGVTHDLLNQGLDNVVDMDYEYASDTLYLLDAGRRQVEVVSLRTQKRAVVYKFDEFEIPISFCVVPDHGTMLVAVVGSDKYTIRIDSISLDGGQRQHVTMNNFKGPHVRLKYAKFMDSVFVSDEGNGVIDFMHPGGSGRENFRELSTTVTSLALTESHVFWTDRRTPRLFWSSIHETTHRVRRISLSIFPNNTQLLIQATSGAPSPTDPLLHHPCLSNPCTDVCVQSPPAPRPAYKCLCPAGSYMEGNKCVKIEVCSDNEFYCRKTNICIEQRKVCDGVHDCVYNEDELGCKALLSPVGKTLGAFFSWAKAHKILWPQQHFPSGQLPLNAQNASPCDETEFQCNGSAICLPRLLVCDSRPDCPDGSDELHDDCDLMQCFDNEFKCATRRSCIPKTWRCDAVDDCGDGSDELDCESMSCKPGQYQCRNRECIDVKKRCDKMQDCFDYSDEENCEEEVYVPFEEAELPNCADYEFACELNKSICLPLTAQCNTKVDCPGGTDENNCDFRCARHGMFACKQQLTCVTMKKVCDRHKDCLDGSDETPDACFVVNKTSHLYPPVLHPAQECRDGYLCDNGQCIETHQVCDSNQDCADNSDEGGQCLSDTCKLHPCAHACSRTPRGPQCACSAGYRLGTDGHLCEDIDECEGEPCSQQCINTPGSFLCLCHHGYALRGDRRSCKATRGNMSVLYVLGDTVRAVSADGRSTDELNNRTVTNITDIDYNVRVRKLYVTSAVQRKLVEVNSTGSVVTVTNIGTPTKVAVEWVTGNVYFVDTTPGDSCIRVCNVRRKRCAKLQKLPSDAEVSSLIVDPKARVMLYCVGRGREGVVWAAGLAGRGARDLAAVRGCAGLAADSFAARLYVAHAAPPALTTMDYSGDHHKVLIEDDRFAGSTGPHGLAIFEDHMYYLVASRGRYRLGRCSLYGSKHCEPFGYQLFDTDAFVIRHESVQRDDVNNECDGVTCSNVCVLAEDGPKCVCDDGSLAADGACKLVEKDALALFNGWSSPEYERAHRASFTIIAVVVVLLALYLGLFFYYHFVYKPRRNRSSAYTEVRYQTTTAGTTLSYAPSLDMTSDGGLSHEFVNPLQYVRNILRQSVRKPIGTAGLSIDLSQSPQQDLSDTESDLDDREKLISIRRK